MSSVISDARPLVLWPVVHPCLPIPGGSPTIRRNHLPSGGFMAIFRIRQFRVWLDAGDGALVFDAAGCGPCLHPRTGAGLHQRRVSVSAAPKSPMSIASRPAWSAKKSQLSPGCRAQFSRSRAPRGRSGPAGRPMASSRRRRAKPVSAKASKPKPAKQAGETAPTQPHRSLSAAAPFQAPFARQTDALWRRRRSTSPSTEERCSEQRIQEELDRHFAWFEAKLPAGPAKFVGWLRKPSSRWCGFRWPFC